MPKSAKNRWEGSCQTISDHFPANLCDIWRFLGDVRYSQILRDKFQKLCTLSVTTLSSPGVKEYPRTPWISIGWHIGKIRQSGREHNFWNLSSIILQSEPMVWWPENRFRCTVKNSKKFERFVFSSRKRRGSRRDDHIRTQWSDNRPGWRGPICWTFTRLDLAFYLARGATTRNTRQRKRNLYITLPAFRFISTPSSEALWVGQWQCLSGRLSQPEVFAPQPPPHHPFSLGPCEGGRWAPLPPMAQTSWIYRFVVKLRDLFFTENMAKNGHKWLANGPKWSEWPRTFWPFWAIYDHFWPYFRSISVEKKSLNLTT